MVHGVGTRCRPSPPLSRGKAPVPLSREWERGSPARQDTANRLEEAQRMLRAREHSLAEIAYELGYSDQSAFTRAFRRWTGLSPRAWAVRHRSATPPTEA
ncbi:MAG: hypothetical protein OHK0015_19230 [Chloroflexi bacterium OHK40]